MADNLQEVPVEVIEVPVKPTAVQSSIGTEDFLTNFVKLIRGGDTWRTPKGLAAKLDVDPVDLAAWMDTQTQLCKRPGKEDGVFFYALAERIEKKEKPKGMDRQAITEEDRYMTALLDQAYKNYLRLLNKYAMRACDRTEEGFKLLLQARDRMSAGVALVINSLKADVDKLPK